jgi:hypothetical protein
MTRINTNPDVAAVAARPEEEQQQPEHQPRAAEHRVEDQPRGGHPAGLIASEILRGEKKGISTAIENAGRAATSSAPPKVGWPKCRRC